MKATLSGIDLELKGLEQQRRAGASTPTPDRSQQGAIIMTLFKS
jgi:hypothetical protein